MKRELITIYLTLTIAFFVQAQSSVSENLFIGKSEKEALLLINKTFNSQNFKTTKITRYENDLGCIATNYMVINIENQLPYLCVTSISGQIRNFFIYLGEVAYIKRLKILETARMSGYTEVKKGFFRNNDSIDETEFYFYTYLSAKNSPKGFIYLWTCPNTNFPKSYVNEIQKQNLQFEVLK